MINAATCAKNAQVADIIPAVTKNATTEEFSEVRIDANYILMSHIDRKCQLAQKAQQSPSAIVEKQHAKNAYC